MEKPQVIITAGESEAHTRYRGEPSQAQAKLAFFNLGQVSLELIEPIGGPSTWKDFLDQKGEGVHHIAFQVKGTQQVVEFLESHAIEEVQRGDYTGGMYTYMDGSAQLGVILELLENF
jgi:methylmalonyl-CoA/ethylmalonyl-CoA epimerase